MWIFFYLFLRELVCDVLLEGEVGVDRSCWSNPTVLENRYVFYVGVGWGWDNLGSDSWAFGITQIRCFVICSWFYLLVCVWRVLPGTYCYFIGNIKPKYVGSKIITISWRLSLCQKPILEVHSVYTDSPRFSFLKLQIIWFSW